MTRRRILLSIRHAVGGIRTYLKYTFGCLDPRAYELMIVTVGGDEGAALREDMKAFAPVIVEIAATRAVPRLAAAVHASCRSWRPHLVHSHGFTAGAASVPGAVLTGTPHLITSHDVFLPHHVAGWKGKLKRAALTAFLNRADLVHAVGSGAADNIRAYLPGFDASKLRMVRNGVPPPPADDPAEGARWRSEVGQPGEALFGFFGRFMPQKGFDVLIDAVEILAKQGVRPFRILAVNDGSFVREYRALIARRGLADRFSFLGFVPNARRLMPWVDAVVMPSLWEACPLQTMEALSAGAPYISTDIPGVRELVEASPAVIVPPRDAAALARAIAGFLAAPEEAISRARAFAGAARERFAVQASAAGLERLYDEILSGR